MKIVATNQTSTAIRQEEFAIAARDGRRLAGRGWLPHSAPKAVVGLVHGLSEHSGRYCQMGEFFARRGYALLAFDLRGHGRSEGQRGHASSLEVLLDDLGHFVRETGRQFPRIPCFLYGHSLGGLLIANYGLRCQPPVQGVVLASASFRNALAEQRLKVLAAQMFGWLLPRIAVSTSNETKGISRDESVERAFRQDSLVHRQITLGLGRCALSAMSYALERAREWKLPLLVMHGTADPMAFASGSEQFARQVPGDCTLKLWPGFFHELHHEPEREEVLTYAFDWMEQRRS